MKTIGTIFGYLLFIFSAEAQIQMSIEFSNNISQPAPSSAPFIVPSNLYVFNPKSNLTINFSEQPEPDQLNIFTIHKQIDHTTIPLMIAHLTGGIIDNVTITVQRGVWFNPTLTYNLKNVRIRSINQSGPVDSGINMGSVPDLQILDFITLDCTAIEWIYESNNADSINNKNGWNFATGSLQLPPTSISNFKLLSPPSSAPE